MTRDIINFSAGPAMLPDSVLTRIRDELFDWQGTGLSVMEIGHRTPLFRELIAKIEAKFRVLMQIPDDYTMLFLAGGARSQFAMVPMNLMTQNGRADYVDSGHWSRVAMAEAARFGDVQVAGAVCENAAGLWQLPESLDFRQDAAYLHYTPNETISGLEYQYVPDSGHVPLVADMTSYIMSRPVDVSKFGLIYAAIQKNLGPAGLTVVIVRRDLIGEPQPKTPTMFQYRVHAEAGSLYNTPPTFNWYVMGLMLDWIEAEGGLVEMARRSERRAKLLYDVIDGSDFYHSRVLPDCRSRMNVSFTLADTTLESQFLSEAEAQGLVYLKGHPTMPGIRASIYIAMPEAGVQRLSTFMQDFEQRHG